jgi:hypothetical protein
MDAVAVALLSDPDADVRLAALEAILQSGSTVPLETLAPLVTDLDERIRRLGVATLSSSTKEELDLLRVAVTDGDAGVRDTAQRMLAVFDLEHAIARHAEPVEVMHSLYAADLFALGVPAGETSGGEPWDEPLKGTEADLLHFTAEDDGEEERVYLPVFTRPERMLTPLENNPEWKRLSVLSIRAGELLANVDDDVTLAINPWSEFEYHLSPGARTRS